MSSRHKSFDVGEDIRGTSKYFNALVHHGTPLLRSGICYNSCPSPIAFSTMSPEPNPTLPTQRC